MELLNLMISLKFLKYHFHQKYHQICGFFTIPNPSNPAFTSSLFPSVHHLQSSTKSLSFYPLSPFSITIIAYLINLLNQYPQITPLMLFLILLIFYL
jgi:hypothetical protein